MIRVHTGAAEHHLAGGRVRRFTPNPGAPLCIFTQGRAVATAGETSHFKPRGGEVYASTPKRNPVERYGGGGLSARLFLGLNVGKKQAWTMEEVVEAVTTIRASQGAPPDASYIAQLGTYTQADVGLVEEPSVQIIIIDTQGTDKDVWERQMRELSQALQERFLQKEVILEIQDKGVITDVFGAREVQ
jgi:hypothetical protein